MRVVEWDRISEPNRSDWPAFDAVQFERDTPDFVRFEKSPLDGIQVFAVHNLEFDGKSSHGFGLAFFHDRVSGEVVAILWQR